MAQLSDLPFEIILLIYSLIPDPYSAREMLRAADRKRRDALLMPTPSTASLEEFSSFHNSNADDRMALFSFRNTCKAFRSLPFDEHFGHVPMGVHAATPLEAMEQVCDTVDLLLRFPEMGSRVQSLYFVVDDRRNEKISLDAGLRSRVEAAATTPAVAIALDVNLPGVPSNLRESIGNNLAKECESEFFLGLGMVILMRLLPNVEHVVFAAPVHTYNWIDLMVPAFGGTVERSPRRIQSFAVQGVHPKQRFCQLLSFSEDAGIFQNGSELCVQDIEVCLWSRSVDNSEVVGFSNLTSLVLSNVGIELEAFERVVDKIARLTKLIITNWNRKESTWRVPAAGEIIDALEKHADSLKTLCLRFNARPDSRHHQVTSLAHFTALENLWIRAAEFRHVLRPSIPNSSTSPPMVDLGVIGFEKPDPWNASGTAFATLPGGLQRLHVVGSPKHVGGDLESIYHRLLAGDPSVRCPRDFRLDGRHTYAQWIVQRFRDFGLHVGDQVDPYPDSW